MGSGAGQSINIEAMDASAAKVFGQSWHIDGMNGGSYAAKWIETQNRGLGIWEVLAGLIGVWALTKQYQQLERQVDLQERAVDQAAEYLDIAKRNYNEISVPTFERVRDFFDYAHGNWRPRIDEFLRDAFSKKEYAPEHDLARGRAMSTVTAQFDNARKMRDRLRGRYRVGQCCADAARFSIAAAEARIAAANVGYRYEDQKAFEIDQWYWNRETAGSQLAMNGLANTVSGINGGAGVATGGLGAIGEGTRSLSAAASSAADSMNNMASFWGNISNGAFGLAGYGIGRGQSGGMWQVTSQQQGGGGGMAPYTMGQPQLMGAGYGQVGSTGAHMGMNHQTMIPATGTSMGVR